MTVFHREPPPWFDGRVPGLKPGGRTRIADGKLVSYNGRAWHLYDFRERESEVYEPQRTLAEKLAAMAAMHTAENEAANSIALPDEGAMPHPKDWPSEARAWLYKASINNDDIHDLGIFWNPKMQRVVIPYETYQGQEAWVARRTHGSGTGPKYLFPYGLNRGGGAYLDNHGDGVGLVLTEDYLSAYRIAKATDYHALAIMGTSLDWLTVVRSSEDYGHIVTWLDPDRYGQLGADKLRQQYGRIDQGVRNITSQVDPKLLSDDALREALET